MHYSVLARIKNFFEVDVWNGTGSEKAKLLRNLIGKRWINDDSISKVFDILNIQHDDTICFVTKPHGLCGSSLPDKIKTTKSKGAKISTIYIALNVGLSPSNSCYVSDGMRKGCHWSLLVLDLEAQHAYYMVPLLHGLLQIICWKQFTHAFT